MSQQFINYACSWYIVTRKKYQNLISKDFINNQFNKGKNMDFDLLVEINSLIHVVDLDLSE